MKATIEGYFDGTGASAAASVHRLHQFKFLDVGQDLMDDILRDLNIEGLRPFQYSVITNTIQDMLILLVSKMIG